MRLKALLLSLAVTLAMTAAVRADIGEGLPAIKLDASTLPLGDVLEWRNDTSCGFGLNWKRFVAVGQPPACEIVDGVQAVTFSGYNGFISDKEGTKPWSMPAEFQENNPYTVVYKVYNPGISGTERVFGWTHTGVSNTQAAYFGYGTNDSYGAVNHWGTSNDMAFDRGVPAHRVWHTICVTYGGITGIEKVYVDGELSSYERKGSGWTNNIIDGHPIYIGATDDPSGVSQNFSGSLAKVLVYSGEATGYEMRVACDLAPLEEMSFLPQLINNSFELVQGDIWVLPKGTTSNNKIESRTIPGWAWVPADQFVTGSTRRGGIAVNTMNLTASSDNVTPGNGWFDNGKAKDGMRVLALWDASNPKSVSQYVYLQQGRSYHIKAYYNACSTGQATINVLANGESVFTETIDPVDPMGYFNTDFYMGEGNFTVPESGIYPIEIRNEMVGDQNVLLVDKIELFDSNGSTAFESQPAALDFGQYGFGSLTNGKATTVTITMDIQNNSGGNMDLMLYQRSSAANSNWANYIDIIDETKPGTNGSTPNITILPYQNLPLTVMFTVPRAYSPANGFTGELLVRWRTSGTAGTYYDTATIPWRAVVPQAPVVLNGSFEMPKQGNAELHPDMWYNVYGMGVIPNWLDKATHGIGIGNRDCGQMVNSGTPPDGRQALWMQSLGADNFYPGNIRSVSQKVAGMFPTRKYRISYWAAARNQGLSRANWQLKINGAVNKPNGITLKTINGIADVTQIGQGNFSRYEHSYTATTTDSVNLEFAMIQENGGESTVLFDDVHIYEEGTPQASYIRGSSYGLDPVPPTGWNYGVVTKGMTSGDKNFRVYNYGGKTLALTNITVVGPKAKNFTRISAATLNVAPYGNYQNINVRFNPKESGALGQAWLQFQTDDTTGTAAAAAGKTYAYSIPLFGTGVDYPYLVNGSFEQPIAYWTQDNDWYRTNGQNIFPTGWSTVYTESLVKGGNGNDRYGVGRPVSRANFLGSDQSFYFNNGKITDGLQAGWIQVGRNGDSGNMSSARGLRQTVLGLQPGITYNWRTLVNARAGTSGQVQWQLRYQPPNTSGAPNGTWQNLVALTTIRSVEPMYSYNVQYKEYKGTIGPFANAGNALFEFWVPWQISDSSLLIDCLQVTGPPVPAVKHWSMFE